MQVVIRDADGKEHICSVSEEACKLVRLQFTPSNLDSVDVLKILAAAFITECDNVIANFPSDTKEGQEIRASAGRHSALAKTHAETASMYGVKAATTQV